MLPFKSGKKYKELDLFSEGEGRFVPSAAGAGEVDVDVDGGVADIGREGMQAEHGAQAGLVYARIA